jgi:hypothetical protein
MGYILYQKQFSHRDDMGVSEHGGLTSKIASLW